MCYGVGSAQEQEVLFDSIKRGARLYMKMKEHYMAQEESNETFDYQEQTSSQEEEQYIVFTMNDINDFIKRYGAKFFYSKLNTNNQKELLAYLKDVPWEE